MKFLLILSMILFCGCHNLTEGKVEAKYIRPAYSETAYIKIGNTFAPVTTYHESQYIIRITLNGKTDDVTVNQGDWEIFKVGQDVIETKDKGWQQYVQKNKVTP